MSKGTPLRATDIIVDRSDPAVAIVRLNRPEKRNCVTYAMWKHLKTVFDELSAASDVRVIVLTGSGGSFCAGADISEFSSIRATAEQGRVYEHAVDLAEGAISGSPKPTVAAISGACVGGGMGLAVACDFRISDTSGYFAIPAARLGIVYGPVETRNLLTAVGVNAAREILYTGRRYNAEEAHRMGLLCRPPAVDLMAAVKEFAGGMRTSAPLTIAGAKVVIDALVSGELDKRRADVDRAIDRSLGSEDYKEGVKAFGEKRAPVFRGR